MKYCIYFLLWLLAFFGATYASVIPDGFIVEVNPSTFDINEAVDVTIKAIKADGTVIKDYDGIVMVELIPTVWSQLWFDEVTLPGEGIVFFEATDLGEKRLSKSLIVKKNGVYTLKVFDIDDENAKWQRELIVWQQQQNAAATVTINAPSLGGIETVSAVTVLADSPELPNSPYQVLVNGLVSTTWVTNSQWSINAIITWLQEWSNSLQIKIIDFADVVLGQSNTITFTYQPSTDEFYNGIQILPSTQTKQWDKIVFNVSTSDAVSSVELLIWTWETFPMDRETAGKFIKQVMIENKWNINVSLRLNAGWNVKLYQNVAQLVVTENVAIWLVKFYTDAVDKSSLTMMWQVIGQSPKFKIRYGTNKDNLSQEQEVSTNEIKIGNVSPTSVYYFQIIPVDQAGNVIGTPSEIKEIDPSSLQAQVTCVVDGIVLNTEEIDDKYYFVRDPVENAEKYIIYRSDSMTSIISEMRKVGETTESRFEYPFDADALQEEFAYFAVQAVCPDGKEILLDEVKKVQVWPYDTLILAIILSVLSYSSRLLYRRTCI